MIIISETNLKVRQSLEETQDIGDDIDHLSSFDGEIECEPPNNNLNRFQGNLKWKNENYPLKNENVLLRGTRLRNTQWVVGSKFNFYFQLFACLFVSCMLCRI